MSQEANEKRKKFRALLTKKTITAMPGGFSPLYARMAQEIGFDAFFIAGSQMSAYLLGVPDTGIIGLRDMVDHARHVAARTTIPILADADTGYGNATNVYYATQEFVRAGVAALSIEDQEAPKKASISGGRRCISIDEAVGKYRAAVRAKNEIDPDFVIVARCDTLGAENGGFEDALKRSIAYIKDGGADLVWVNSIESRAQTKEACAQIPGPVMVIWGGTEEPAPTIPEWEQLGVRIALYPTIASVAGMHAAWQLMSDFKARGTQALDDWRDSRKLSADYYKLVDWAKIRELEAAFMPATQQRDYEATWGHGDAVDSKKA
jgi:2-methylisocitrate lyase-like PEP mutase family enzyme